MRAPRPSLMTRAAQAFGAFVGRAQAEAQRRRGEGLAELAERPTGRLDHTWSARASSTSRAYEAATQNRDNADWRAGLTSATTAILEGLDVMLARSRWLIRNDGYAASAQGGYRRRVVGGGITARSAARHPDDGQMLANYNRQLDLLWNAWAGEPTVCDVERTKCLAEKQALWMDELFAAGGLFLRPVYAPRTETVGLAIQELEYEQLNRDLTSYGGNAVYNGIETDAYGAPVAYHLYAASHPLEEVPSAPTRLLASECWHLFRKGRVRQRIGAPMMHAVMPALRSLAMYELYTVSKARTEAAYHGFVEEPASSTATLEQIRARISGKTPTGEAATDDVQVRVENGLFPVVRGGGKVVFPQPGTPNTVYAQFVSEQLKRIAAGAGLDLPTVSRWYAEGNFNTQRKAALEIEAETEAIQDLQFINGALRGVRRMFVEIAIREGKLSATGFLQSARWQAAYLSTNWQGPPQRSVDPIRDQAAWDMQYRSLRGTPQDYFNERGTTPEEALAAWQEFLAMAEARGLGDVMRQFFGLTTVNAPKAGMAPDGTGPDSDPGAAGGVANSAHPPVAPPSRGGGPGGNGHRKPLLGDLIAERLVLAAAGGDGEGKE